MRLEHICLTFSATDLANFSACGQRVLLDRLRAHGLAGPDYSGPDPRLEDLRRRGMEHEQAYLERLRAEGKRIVLFDGLPRDAGDGSAWGTRAAATEVAMREGADVIYQGAFSNATWRGLVDFLVRVERPSDLGGWSYEVVDAKLAREAKAAAILQTCVYSELLEGAQGVQPECIHLYLGGPLPRLVSFRLAHFAAYYRSLKRRFLAHVVAATDTPPEAPEPVELCQICEWRSRCNREREAADHLSLVAGIVRDQRRALERANVTTLEALANLPLDSPSPGLQPVSFRRVREQARVQLEGRRREAPYHELLPLQPNEQGPPLGLAALPLPTPHDLFFDIEGAENAFKEGLEYLFGLSDGEDHYRATWALSPAEEKAALDAFLTRAAAHVTENPGAHIYHFGHYETVALKRLVGRYGIRTEELDGLLQGQVFVDLHRVVKQSVLASAGSYSLKALEAHFGFTRAVPLADANPARMRLELALGQGHQGEPVERERAVVEGYNRDDCVSLRALRVWLEALRAGLEVQSGQRIPRPGPPVIREDPENEEAQREVRELMERLLEGVPAERETRTDLQHIQWLSAHLLEWHRREDKSLWWDYFRLRELSVEELVEETKPLAGLEYVGVVRTEKRSKLHRFRFPPQTHRLEPGSKGIEPARGEDERTAYEVWDIDELNGTVDLKVGPTKERDFGSDALRALIPNEIVPTEGQKARLRETARRLREGLDALDAWSPASAALLLRRPPELEDGVALHELAPAETLLERCKQAALRLQRGVLPVQGPPGTGKTYSGARMIRALLRAGRRVGVTGPSHKVITNLLDAVCAADVDDPETTIDGLQVSREEPTTDPRFEIVQGAAEARKALAGRADNGRPLPNLIAGTSWLWSADAWERSVDVLFIDEAGQFPLANALAVAPAAPRLVLLGDPQQLNQPQKGVHPPGTEASVLEHLAEEDGLIAPERGIFLSETWRMRPEITAFTSELFYERKLRARPSLELQKVTLTEGPGYEGLVLLEMSHEGNSRESVEEADALVGLFRRILGSRATFTDDEGCTRPLMLRDLLVVAPYNAQVSRIKERLAAAGFPEARVGTVDKFQGQEAPIAIYSLASSSAEDAPRGMHFLYALDRLNVATSRARVATFVVASPRIFTAECKRPEQMRLVNAFVRYGEVAGR